MTGHKIPTPPEKYGVGQAIADVSKSIASNFSAYVVSTVVMIVALFAFISLGDLLIYSPVPILFFLFWLLVVPFFIHVYQAFTMATISVIIKAHLEGKKLQVLQPLKETLPAIKRITLANLLCNVIAFSPFILAALIMMLGWRANVSSGLLTLVPLLFLIGLVWFLIVGVRYCLSAVIAQHEPKVPIKQTLKRSKELLGASGQWIIVLGAILGGIVMAIVANPEVDSLFLTIMQLMLILVILSYMFGGLGAIYFNRVAHHKK